MKPCLAAPALALVLVLLAAPGRADDLDDGIPVDDNILLYSEIGNHADLNFSYLSQRARSRAASSPSGWSTRSRNAKERELMPRQWRSKKYVAVRRISSKRRP